VAVLLLPVIVFEGAPVGCMDVECCVEHHPREGSPCPASLQTPGAHVCSDDPPMMHCRLLSPCMLPPLVDLDIRSRGSSCQLVHLLWTQAASCKTATHNIQTAQRRPLCRCWAGLGGGVRAVACGQRWHTSHTMPAPTQEQAVSFCFLQQHAGTPVSSLLYEYLPAAAPDCAASGAEATVFHTPDVHRFE
jgi:hypothetical protein